MRINHLFKEKKAVLSFEIFPPKITSPIETIYGTLEALSGLSPDYISITYGAGGASSNNRTLELASLVKNKYGIESLAHLTAIHSDKAGVLAFLEKMHQQGLENILALRGDKREGFEVSKDFRYASDLVQFIKQNGTFSISGACYSEGHFESASLDEDLQNLKIKVDSGVTHLNSQLFFDNDSFYKFIEKARRIGINVPIQAGIMPIINKRQIERTVSLSGGAFPTKFSKLIARYGDNDEAMRAAGIAYATEQIIDLLANDAEGIHLYIMNNATVARQITDNIAGVLKGTNGENQ
jgi:methylenetetrahydrofolate reductase (NADPH)